VVFIFVPCFRGVGGDPGHQIEKRSNGVNEENGEDYFVVADLSDSGDDSTNNKLSSLPSFSPVLRFSIP
jgi:hypothetical protein